MGLDPYQISLRHSGLEVLLAIQAVTAKSPCACRLFRVGDLVPVVPLTFAASSRPVSPSV